MIDAEFESNSVQDDSFEEQNPFFELSKVFSLGIERGSCGGDGAGGCLRESSGLNSSVFELVALVDDEVEFLGAFFGFGSEDNSTQTNTGNTSSSRSSTGQSSRGVTSSDAIF